MGLKEWLSNLLAIDENTWITYAFEREPFKGKLSFDEYKGFYEKAFAEGKDAAVKIKESGILDASSLKDKLGVKVEDFTLEQVGGLGAFALFIEPDTIQILKDNADKTTELLRMESETPSLKNLDVYTVVLTHELFHVIQYQNKDMFINQKHITLSRFLGLERRVNLRSLEEVAAFAFVREFLSLPFNPEILNPIMLIHNNRKEADRLYKKLMEFNGSTFY